MLSGTSTPPGSIHSLQTLRPASPSVRPTPPNTPAGSPVHSDDEPAKLSPPDRRRAGEKMHAALAANLPAKSSPALTQANLEHIDAELNKVARQLEADVIEHVPAESSAPPAAGLTPPKPPPAARLAIESSHAQVAELVQDMQVHGAGHADPAVRASMQKSATFVSDMMQGLMHGGSNYLKSMARDGSITTATTMLREIVGYMVANKAGNLSENEKAGLAAGFMALAMGLNLVSAATQKYKGTGNARTLTAQGVNLALLGVVTAVASHTGTLGAAMPMLAKATAYSLLRDTANSIITMEDARDKSGKPPSVSSTFKNLPLYAAVSTMVNYLQGTSHAISGTGAAAKGMDLKDALGKILAFSLSNGLGEALDGANLSYFIAHEQAGAAKKAGDTSPDARKGMTDVTVQLGVHKPTMGQYVDKITGAMNGRMAAFAVIFGMIGALGKVPMSADKQEHFMNCMIGLAIGAFCPIFVAAFSTSPAPARAHADPSPV